MNAATLADRPATGAADLQLRPARTIERFALLTVDQWLEACREFLAWHRQNRLLNDASPALCAEADRAHAWLLRTAHTMQGQILDPDFPQPAMARRVEGALWQLREAWSQTHSPLSEADADRLLAHHFPPDEPGA